jgi:putative two-component system response regulator
MSFHLTEPEDRVQILVVDDEPQVRELLIRWLSSAGHSCLGAENATAAWELLQQREFHLVTCDLRMPGESGIDLLGKIVAQFPETAAIMLTSNGDTRTAIEALTLGATGYLIKPVVREELLLQVSRGLERRRLILENRSYLEQLQQKVDQQTIQIRQAHEETIHRLVAATLYRDEETGAHIRRTGLFGEVLARAAGWSVAEAERLRFAAPMHDVGKIGIPDAVLRKPGRLTDHEFGIMKQHTTIGARMLAGSPSPILQMARDIALCHHERWDGTGYPVGLSGQAIPESARILSIVDVYDALTHDRVYRPAFPPSEVISLMQRGCGTHFEPGLLATFFTVLEEIDRISAAHPDSHGEEQDMFEQLAVTLSRID